MDMIQEHVRYMIINRHWIGNTLVKFYWCFASAFNVHASILSTLVELFVKNVTLYKYCQYIVTISKND